MKSILKTYSYSWENISNYNNDRRTDVTEVKSANLNNFSTYIPCDNLDIPSDTLHDMSCDNQNHQCDK